MVSAHAVATATAHSLASFAWLVPDRHVVMIPRMAGLSRYSMRFARLECPILERFPSLVSEESFLG
jgi:hypothetical protein